MAQIPRKSRGSADLTGLAGSLERSSSTSILLASGIVVILLFLFGHFSIWPNFIRNIS
jgi:hypothetical protein